MNFRAVKIAAIALAGIVVAAGSSFAESVKIGFNAREGDRNKNRPEIWQRDT